MNRNDVKGGAASRLQAGLLAVLLAVSGGALAHDWAHLAGRYEHIVPAGRVAIVSRDRAWGLVDAQGQPITALRYEDIEPFGERDAPQGFVVQAGQRQGVLDADGGVVTDAIWTTVRPVKLSPQASSSVRWLFEVRQGHREGLLDQAGRAVLPVQFGELSWVGRHSPWVIVRQGGLQGVCDARSGECPLPGADAIDVLHAKDDGALHVLVQTGLERRQLVLTSDDSGRWQVRPPDRPSPIRARRDDHPLALRQGAVIDARYVPRDLSDAEAVQRAHDGKRLRELRQPSIQLSAWTAYVGFDLFSRPGEVDAAPLPSVWTRCPDPVGVRLVAWHGEWAQQAQACASPKVAAVHLKPVASDEGNLLCEGCEALGLPQHWLRRDEPPVDARCVAPPAGWHAEQARRDYARWLAAWLPTWQPVLQGQPTSQVASEGWSRHQADPSRALSTLSALSRRPEALLRDLGLDGQRAPKLPLGEALLKWLRRAEPVGDGGLYPEPEPEFAGQCAQVWYLRWPELEQRMRARPAKAGQPFAMGLRLPPAGQLARQAYPFLTFSRGADGNLQLSGVSREVLQAVWLLEGGR
jgi:hypothetical protein